MTSSQAISWFLIITIWIVAVYFIHRQQKAKHALKVEQDLAMIPLGLRSGEYWRLHRKCQTEEGRQKIIDLISVEVDGEQVVLEEDLPPYLRKDLRLCPACEESIEPGIIFDILGGEFEEFEVIEFACPHCQQEIICELADGFTWDIYVK